MHKFNDAYARIKRILGSHTEPLASAQLVEEYRRYMKPEKVNVILLAESHVHTSDSDRAIAIPSLARLPNYPTQYAKFVYCLGYGEREMTRSKAHPLRDGTPQFWKILFSCINEVSCPEDFKPVLKKCTEFAERIDNKIDLLKDLRTQGIWLVDASIVALYRSGRKVPNMFAALEESWQSYTRDVIVASNPQHVICIGKGVADVVENDLRADFGERYSVIPQPNAFLSSEAHMENFKKYRRICSQFDYERSTKIDSPKCLVKRR